MKWTRTNVAEFAANNGLQPIQVDGVPEGFSFKEPDIEIGGIEHTGRTVIFTPLTDQITYE